ncbi:hypothetical protein M407DRAFT_243207 [Tulasnella calospora MUT 4182]|uniref:Uncharacterized protein n=1 Tax=Tulasnella calospora MUT 4182 TaxID=1051891 RepID=A0A0C3QBN2_9AGAM|nr:hypothetical protein M407DRAFT_243207 [Tulasnella calospora MUT 4182]
MRSTLRRFATSSSQPPRKGLWQTYEGLPKKTRLYFGLGMGAIGVLGLMVSDRLESNYPAAPSSTAQPGTPQS